MKFVIIESGDNLLSNKEKVYQFIQKECGDFLAESNNIPVYRGMAATGGWDQAIMTTRKDRWPRTTPPEIHNFLDNLFYKKFGWRARSSGLFGTGDFDWATYFTKNYVYRIYPADGYTYLWAPDIKDLFNELDITVVMGKVKYNKKELQQIIPRSYKTTDLVEAIKSGHEIMFNCKRYAVVAVDGE
jgi:hypothetical protein